MSSTLKDLRLALDQMAGQHGAPDPHAVLADAQSRATSIGRRRTISRVVAVAAAVAAIGAAGVLLNNGDDTLGQIDPAEPDESYAERYGFINGEPQPFMEGLRLVGTASVDPGRERVVELEDVSGEDELFAVAWCSGLTGEGGPAAGVTFANSGGQEVEPQCYDQTKDVNSNQIVTPLPPLDDVYLLSNKGSEPAIVALYAEASWREYPFPDVEPSPFPAASAGGVVIDSTTPVSREQNIEAIPEGSPVYRARVPITEETAGFTVEMNRPGQVLVAIDGVVVTNDEEELLGQPDPGLLTWSEADPMVRDGFLTSYGPPVARSFYLDEVFRDRFDVDASDGELAVTVYTRGFVDNSSWRVTYVSNAGTGTAAREPLVPLAQSDFPEYALGHRLVAAFDVPSDGVPRSLEWKPQGDAELTWVAECTGFIPGEGGRLQPDVGTVTSSAGTGTLLCSPDNGWASPLKPEGLGGATSHDGPKLTALAADDQDTRRVAAYEPVAFDDFPFEEVGDVLDVGGFDGNAAEEQRADGVIEFVERDTEVVTLDDLDQAGTAVLDVPDTRLNQFYVTTEGRGRFWVEPVGPDGGALTAGASLFMGLESFGRDDYWTSWTSDRITWPIEAKTDDGVRPEQVRLRVEGYEEGSFTFRVTGQFPVEDQP